MHLPDYFIQSNLHYIEDKQYCKNIEKVAHSVIF